MARCSTCCVLFLSFAVSGGARNVGVNQEDQAGSSSSAAGSVATGKAAAYPQVRDSRGPPGQMLLEEDEDSLSVGTQWKISTSDSDSCDDVCTKINLVCEQSSLDALALSSQKVKDAFGSAGRQCDTFYTHCAEYNRHACSEWGSPYVHVAHMHTKECWGGADPSIAPCDKKWNGHRRLCPCTSAAENADKTAKQELDQEAVIAATDDETAPTAAPAAAPSATVEWKISTADLDDCNAVCTKLNLACDESSLSALTSDQKVKDAFAKAGRQCGTFYRHCAEHNRHACRQWGSPYVHVAHMHDGSCWGGNDPSVASCGCKTNMHRRLCPCIADGGQKASDADLPAFWPKCCDVHLQEVEETPGNAQESQAANGTAACLPAFCTTNNNTCADDKDPNKLLDCTGAHIDDQTGDANGDEDRCRQQEWFGDKPSDAVLQVFHDFNVPPHNNTWATECRRFPWVVDGICSQKRPRTIEPMPGNHHRYGALAVQGKEYVCVKTAVQLLDRVNLVDAHAGFCPDDKRVWDIGHGRQWSSTLCGRTGVLLLKQTRCLEWTQLMDGKNQTANKCFSNKLARCYICEDPVFPQYTKSMGGLGQCSADFYTPETKENFLRKCNDDGTAPVESPEWRHRPLKGYGYPSWIEHPMGFSKDNVESLATCCRNPKPCFNWGMPKKQREMMQRKLNQAISMY